MFAILYFSKGQFDNNDVDLRKLRLKKCTLGTIVGNEECVIKQAIVKASRTVM